MRKHHETAWALATSLLMIFFVVIGLYAFRGRRSTTDASGQQAAGPLVLDKKKLVGEKMAKGEHITLSVDIKNNSGRNVSILGCATGCFGIPRNRMPFTLAAGGHQPFNIDVLVPSRTGKIESELLLYTDDVRQPSIRLPIEFSVIEKGAE